MEYNVTSFVILLFALLSVLLTNVKIFLFRTQDRTVNRLVRSVTHFKSSFIRYVFRIKQIFLYMQAKVCIPRATSILCCINSTKSIRRQKQINNYRSLSIKQQTVNRFQGYASFFSSLC